MDPRRLFQGITIALVALALAASVLAHHTPSRGELQLAAWQASIGISADFCGDVGGDDGKGSSCEFCHIASSTLLPEIGFDLRAADAILLAEIVLPELRRAEVLALDHIRLTRGPPAA
jgi:hypothetical protein